MKETFTTYEISQICNVFVSTVANWVDEGKLPAYRTPGGHRRVLKKDLSDFLLKYHMPIPNLLLEQEEKKILIVDDDSRVVKLTRNALLKRDPSYVISTASDGFEAGKQVISFKPHVVILDIVLPGLDGFEVCQNMKRDPTTAGISVIVITGHDEPSMRQQFKNLGIDDYLVKPMNLDQLADKVQELLKTKTSQMTRQTS